MNCLTCGSGKLVTFRSTDRESNPVRRRKCTNCDYRTTTIEISYERWRQLEKSERLAILREIERQQPHTYGATI